MVWLDRLVQLRLNIHTYTNVMHKRKCLKDTKGPLPSGFDPPGAKLTTTTMHSLFK